MLHQLQSLLILATLSCTAPLFEERVDPNGAGCSTENVARPERVAALKLYRAICNVYPSYVLFQRAVPCVAGQRISFDAGAVCATWWVTALDSAGNESDLRCAPSYTVNVPSVSVAEATQLAQQGRIYGVNGGRVRIIERSGIYFIREGGPPRAIRVTR